MLLRVSGWIVLVALTGAPGMVHAQRDNDNRAAAASGASAGRNAALTAERQRLRTDLDRINGEIDAMKREVRGLRDDYRLRNRMADAEALARRLTEVDARLQAAAAASGTPASAGAATARPAGTPWPTAPEAQPSDDRATLEAKADILADQARRLNSQADLLAGRVSDLRARQELRRRAGQLERDPFSQLEQSKRRLAASGTSSPSAFPSGPKEVSGSSSPPPRSDTSGAPTVVVGVPTGSPTAGGPTTPPPSGASPGFTGNGTGVGSQATGGGEKPQPSLVSPGATSVDASAAASVSTQFRGILDASTLAEIRRLEIAGAPTGNLLAMERALSALRARAAQLTANSNTLRSRAKVAP